MRLSIAVILLLASSCIFSQKIILNTKDLAKVETKDGSSIYGTITEKDKKFITLKTEYGENRIKRSDVINISYINEEELKTQDDTYSGSHYYFAPSAFNLKKGQSYYENIYLGFNSVTFGLTDNFSLTAGVEVFSLLFGPSTPFMFVTPKVSLPFSHGAFSVSSTIGIIPDTAPFGITQAALTFGNLRDNITFSTGLGFNVEDGFEDSLVPITISGVKRISDNLSLMSENWMFIFDSTLEGIFSLGLRIHGKNSNNFLSICLFRPSEDIEIFALPFFSGTVAIK